MMTSLGPAPITRGAVSHAGYADPPTATEASAVWGTPLAVSVGARRTMQANRGTDTRPERRLRSLLHVAGMRYRVNMPIPGNRRRRADITFTKVGLYVFVDGCFWHGCPTHFVVPKTRTKFWVAKIEDNRRRDRETTKALQSEGATVLRVWEHEPPEQAAAQVVAEYFKLREFGSKLA